MNTPYNEMHANYCNMKGHIWATIAAKAIKCARCGRLPETVAPDNSALYRGGGTQLQNFKDFAKGLTQSMNGDG